MEPRKQHPARPRAARLCCRQGPGKTSSVLVTLPIHVPGSEGPAGTLGLGGEGSILSPAGSAKLHTLPLSPPERRVREGLQHRHTRGPLLAGAVIPEGLHGGSGPHQPWGSWDPPVPRSRTAEPSPELMLRHCRTA